MGVNIRWNTRFIFRKGEE